jgi:hypothetical protein
MTVTCDAATAAPCRVAIDSGATAPGIRLAEDRLATGAVTT